MLRIAICDDEIKDIKIIKELTVNLLDALQLTYEIEEFLDGSLLLLDSPLLLFPFTSALISFY